MCPIQYNRIYLALAATEMNDNCEENRRERKEKHY